jgi:hypothetical protein
MEETAVELVVTEKQVQEMEETGTLRVKAAPEMVAELERCGMIPCRKI